jgi:hypothetical protein
MADAGIDMGESSIEKKYVPVPFLPAGLRRELGSSEVNEELGRSGAGLVGAAAFHDAVPPLSPRDESLFPFPSCRRNVPWDFRGGLEGREEASVTQGYPRTGWTHARNSAGTPVRGVARGNS